MGYLSTHNFTKTDFFYHNPNDFQVQLAPFPNESIQSLPDDITPAEEVILRLIYNWGAMRREALQSLTGHSRSRIQQLVSRLIEKRYLKSLGWIYSREFPIEGEVLAPGEQKAKEQIFCFKRFQKYPSVSENDSDLKKGFRTNQGLFIPFHQHYVTESAAWITQFLLNQQIGCVPYPESVLRHGFGWYSENSSHETNFFLTPIPDVWFILDQISFRLAVC